MKKNRNNNGSSPIKKGFTLIKKRNPFTIGKILLICYITILANFIFSLMDLLCCLKLLLFFL